ncbi:Atrochrysone carboxyl ACP thioesterase [Fulvia fulva]|uniref:Atrochrysone carboxyl ACP thioesterase n=1 Tax=Passalora fulva TaxID=5499 RepID=CLAF_PASFU|nr:Atrochrysone carboxyl ACP thioesterase [Fulvia fulva]P0CU68.1 RecName: Full=Atrochrysone carboxyl ACP thioesterase; Short=ACTE; AltName: Full=Cladofulvin biosynthesis cluster protein F [Fulvia fulva]KAK4611864.1 Atrochrysone carboxyl ACP thioesterase [Fulvia fulva]KAK4612525.1 Atrochrysone carboxyl ACP thioesterase [Fulvia fulva]UJO23481.1 Atrochrysone carboxyl ACP thioesterase [Fulvia fulva]WPV21049.1 Atrochrysone carboxyl ACP thioesterase [Fulvia fulva]WPV36031.1 Atrochrysone carboxyl AC
MDDKGGYRQINSAFNACAFDDILGSQMAQLPELPDVEQLTPRVLRILGQNPGKFTFQGTNTYVIGTGRQRLIIDTGGGEADWASLINDTLKARGITIARVLLTHWHGDHTGGVADLIRLYPDLEHHIYKNQPDRGQQNIYHAQTFDVEGATVRALHTPGHSEDHMCFILEEEGEPRAMFTGDTILGHGTSTMEDLSSFMDSLQNITDQQCEVGYSAHGAVIENLPLKMVQELRHKTRREAQVLTALASYASRGQRSLTTSELVAEIYGQSLNAETRAFALEPFIDQVLRKLAGDGKVGFEVRAGQRKWFIMDMMQGSIRPARSGSAREILVAA